MRHRTAWIVAAGVAVVAAAVLAPPPVRGEIGVADLAVADAYGYATPLGTVFRIPNQLDGGALLTKSTLTLDKAQATAAGYTPGELGEAFLQTSVVAPEGTPAEVGEHVTYSNPSLVTAQTPPSEVFPAEASIAGGGVHHAGIEALSLRAVTAERRSAADAIGGLAAQADGALTFGAAGSRTHSQILEDGTVVSESHAFVSDLRLRNGLLRIGGVDSVARVSVRPGSDPVSELHVDITGARVADIPVVIDQHGIRIEEAGLVSHAEVRAVNEALAAMAEQGLTVTVFPGIVEESDERSATVGGAALSIRGDLTDYIPTAVDTPLGPQGSPLGDVGTDDELLIGQVRAAVIAAERGPLPALALPSEISQPSATSEPGEVAPRSTTTRGHAPMAGGANDAAPEPRAAVEAPRNDQLAAADESPLELIRRQAPPGVAELRAGYRWVLLSALVGTVALLVRRRARLI